MSGRYVRNVKPGERFDPTMTGVTDVSVFRIADFIRDRDGYSRITQITEAPFGKDDTRFLHLVDLGIQVPPAASWVVVHDLRENDRNNMRMNGYVDA